MRTLSGSFAAKCFTMFTSYSSVWCWGYKHVSENEAGECDEREPGTAALGDHLSVGSPLQVTPFTVYIIIDPQLI